MGFKILSDEKGVKIFRKDIESQKSGKTFPKYSTSISKKNVNGEGYEKSYIDIKFKNGVDIGNGAVIKVNNAFLTFDSYNGVRYNKIFVSDFEVVKEGARTYAQNADNFLDGSDSDANFMIPDGIDTDLPFV